MVLYNALEDLAICHLKTETMRYTKKSRWKDIVRILNSMKRSLRSSKKKYTVSMIRNRYIRLNENSGNKKNMCHICGRKKRGHSCITQEDRNQLPWIYETCDTLLQSMIGIRNDAHQMTREASEEDISDSSQRMIDDENEYDIESEYKDLPLDYEVWDHSLTPYEYCCNDKTSCLISHYVADNEGKNDVLDDPLFQEYLTILTGQNYKE